MAAASSEPVDVGGAVSSGGAVSTTDPAACGGGPSEQPRPASARPQSPLRSHMSGPPPRPLPAGPADGAVGVLAVPPRLPGTHTHAGHLRNSVGGSFRPLGAESPASPSAMTGSICTLARAFAPVAPRAPPRACFIGRRAAARARAPVTRYRPRVQQQLLLPSWRCWCYCCVCLCVRVNRLELMNASLHFLHVCLQLTHARWPAAQRLRRPRGLVEAATRCTT